MIDRARYNEAISNGDVPVSLAPDYRPRGRWVPYSFLTQAGAAQEAAKLQGRDNACTTHSGNAPEGLIYSAFKLSEIPKSSQGVPKHWSMSKDSVQLTTMNAT